MSALDRVSWSAGDFIVAGGRRYKINTSSTYHKLGVALPSSNGVATQKVIIYFDATQTPEINVDGEISYNFSVRPATSTLNNITVFKESSTNWKVGWAEYGDPKAKWSLSFEVTPSTTAGHPLSTHVPVPADTALAFPSNTVTINDAGIIFGGSAAFSSDGQTALTPANTNLFLKFKDNADLALGDFGGARISVDDTGAPWFTHAMADDNHSYSHYIWGAGTPPAGHFNMLLFDMNRGAINNYTSLSQSVHTQLDGENPGQLVTLTQALNVGDTSFTVSDGSQLTNGWRISILQENSTTVWEEMLISGINGNTITVAGRGFQNTDASTHSNGAYVRKSWDNSGATSGARQHVRIPPNNAFTARTSSNNGPAESGWAYNSDIESNKLGPYALVLERSQALSTGHPNRPWNTQWRQLGAAFQTIAVSGQTTITAEKDSGAVNQDELTLAVSGITATTNNSTKTLTLAGMDEATVMVWAIALG